MLKGNARKRSTYEDSWLHEKLGDCGYSIKIAQQKLMMITVGSEDSEVTCCVWFGLDVTLKLN